MTIEPGQRQRALRIARSALELYGIADATVELLRHKFAQVFRVRAAWRREFALRLYGVSEAVREPVDAEPRRYTTAALRSPAVLRSQQLWLSALRRDTGLLVPEPVPTLYGELVGEVRVEGTPWRRHSTLARWVPGVHKESEDLTEADLLRVGSVVARMHDHAEGYVLPEGSEIPRWDWRWPLGETAPLWNEGLALYSEKEMEVFSLAARRVRERVGELGEGKDVFGPIHRDLGLHNIVFSGPRVGVFSGKQVGVHDFDLCGYGHYLFDLSVLRRSLYTFPKDHRRLLWESFLGGYERVRPLPERICACLDRYLGVFDVMQRIAAINRRLELLKTDTTEHEARDAALRFLKTSQQWLRKRLQHLAALPWGLDGLPYFLCELRAI